MLPATMPIQRSVWTLLLAAAVLAGCITSRPTSEEQRRALADALQRRALPLTVPAGTKVDSVAVNDSLRTFTVFFSPEFSYAPFRPEDMDRIYGSVRGFYGGAYGGYTFSIRSLHRPIEDLIPNYFRKDPGQYDKTRLPIGHTSRPGPIVTNLSRPYLPKQGLFNKNISLWHSHGWYFNNTENRWEWQRPRLFQSVEDLGPLSFTLPYLIPMLENAGARVFVPRERDIQTHEVIVDNDSPSEAYVEKAGNPDHAWTDGGPGFRPAVMYPGNVNPFSLGTARRTIADVSGSSSIRWIPAIPETGDYAVYISFTMADSNVADAEYTVFHAGGTTRFRVDQRQGGGTWLYLGTFRFREGVRPDSGQVLLTNKSAEPGRYVTADAVRFGGGMGVVERGGAVSGRPRFIEGARYYLQFAGAPDTLVYNLNKNENDYKDDYQSRAEFGNYLYGAPYGPNKNRAVPGLHIPMDLSLAFHTDAGIANADTTVGTLSIYSVESFDSSLTYPDGVSRLANRDFADIMQTQIVNDLRILHDPLWHRRELRNGDYSESVRPNFPGALLELLSHQNFLDMKFMQDPRFRFDVSRAIYKSMLRFLSLPDNPQYVVQPLPVSHCSAELTNSGDVLLRWSGENDPLEPTARPDGYIVYTRNDDGGFDNGIRVASPTFMLHDLPFGRILSFKVTAVNNGGESFPSEILSVCRAAPHAPSALVVNGFHRVAGPATVEAAGFSGFLNSQDAGVPDHLDYNFTGSQYDFDPKSPFRSNDSPGHGASQADDETRIIAGNSFDYPSIHGASLRAAGFSFSSCSAEAVQDSMIDLHAYTLVDLILGKQKITPRVRPALDSLYGVRFETFPTRLREQLATYSGKGGWLFVSGSYVGSDLYSTAPRDSSGVRFAREVLKCTWVTGHAAVTGGVKAAGPPFLSITTPLRYAAQLNDKQYAVESPDALAPVKGGSTLLRYAENLFGAAVGSREGSRVVVMGFPFESLVTQESRNGVMRAVVNFLRGE